MSSFVELIRRSVDELNEDVAFEEAARYFPLRVEFRQDQESMTLDIRDGKIVGLAEGRHRMGADLVIAGSSEDWSRLARGESDWFEATNAATGSMTVEGNVVSAYRNVRAMYLLMKGVSRAGGAQPSTEFAPDPVWTDREVIGRYVTVDGIRTYYEEAGEGQPIVCIHAAEQDTMQWRYVVDGLSDQYRVIAVDAPGHGKSLEPKGGQWKTLAKHVEFNEMFIEVLGLDRPVVMGCSMGGNMVLDLCSRSPKAYAAGVSAEGSDHTPTYDQFHNDMLLLNGQMMEGTVSESLMGNRTPPDRYREVVWQITRATPEAMNGDLTGYAAFDVRDRVRAIECPLLLVRGDADWLVSQERMEATHSRIPRSEMLVLRGCGHYPMVENPVEYVDAVRAFLAKHGV